MAFLPFARHRRGIIAFDEILKKMQDEVVIRYGVMHGNNTILLIKSGCGGSYDVYGHNFTNRVDAFCGTD